ncbi:MAG: hypothetical protein AAB522_00045, partial [Patescibacteria group bacterium]
HLQLIAEISGDLIRFEDVGCFVLKHAEEYLFPDTKLFLKELALHGYNTFLVTAGTAWFQEAKIAGSGILQFLTAYKVVKDPTKCFVIPSLCTKKDKVVLFDDSKNVIDAIKKEFPHILAIQVLRDTNPVVGNLKEAMGTLLAHQKPL